jgi:branched-chain amino acid transport system substrate-binding protein
VGKRRRFSYLILSAAVLAGLLVAACAPAAAPTPTPTKAPPPPAPKATAKPAEKPIAKLKGTEVKLAVLAPKTGPVSAWGVETEQVTKMVEKEINAAGGIGGLPVRLMFFDTQAKPDVAVSLVRKLYTEDKVLLILGPHLSSETSVAFPIAVSLKAPIFSYGSAAPGISAKNRPWAFRLPKADDQAILANVRRFIKEHNIKRAVVVGDQKDAYSKILSNRFVPPVIKESGAEVVNGAEPIGFNTGDTSFAAQVTRIKELNPDGIFVFSLPAEGGAFVKEVRRQGLKQPILGPGAWLAKQFLDAGGEAVEGVELNAVWDVNHPNAKTFVANFRKAYGKDPTMVGAYVYDSIYITKHVIETSGVTNDPAELAKDWVRIRDGLKNLKYEGIIGKSSFDKNGDGIHTTYQAVVKGGKLVVLYDKILTD